MVNQLRKLHPLESLGNEPAGQGGVRVERLEQRLRPRVPFPHKHDFFHFLHIERGSGWHEVDFRRYRVNAGSFFLVKPAEVHAWSLGASTKGTVLEFVRGSLPAGSEGILRALESVPSHGILLEDEASLLKVLHSEFKRSRGRPSAALEHLLSAFLLLLAGRVLASKPAKGNPVSEKLRALLEANFHRQHSVEFYARELGLAPKALTTRTTREIGKSAGAVIQERLLVEAKRLLAHSELTVAEICYELGYEDPSYFARFFRQKAGMAPGKYRELARHTVHG